MIAGVPSGARQGARLSITVEADARALEGLTITRVSGDRIDTAVPFVLQKSAGVSVSLSVDCIPGTLVLRTDRLVSAPMAVEPGTCDRPRKAELFARGALHGIIRAEEGPTPEVATFEIRRCTGSGARTQFLGRYYSRVDRGGAFDIAVPADCLDASLIVPSYAPVVLPRFALTAGQRKAIGVVILTRGASLSVRVVDDSGSPVAGASVTVANAAEYPGIAASVLKGDAPALGRYGASDATGLTRITGLRPDLAYIVARANGRIGFAGPLELAPAQEAIATVRVASGAAVSVTVSGDRGWLNPPTRLAVTAMPRVMSRLLPNAFVRQVLTDESAVELSLPIAGTWTFQLDVEDQGNARLAATRTVDVHEGAGNLVQFDITRDRYDGHVKGAGASLTGVLRLQPEDADTVGLFSTNVESGAFSVFLPGPGKYNVEFSSADRSVLQARTTVTAVAPNRPLEIRLPVGRVAGVVVRPDGTPAANASVSLKATDIESLGGLQIDPLVRRAGPTGAFEFTAVTDGEFAIAASLDDQQSDPELVTVRESGGPPLLRVVLQPTNPVVGWVVGVNGEPIPGVTAEAIAEAEVGQMPGVTQFTTDMQGFFRTRLDRPVHGWVQIVVSAVGRPVTVFRLRPTIEAVKLVIPATGGACRIDFPPAPDAVNALPSDALLYALLSEEGGILSFAALSGLNAASVVPRAEATTVSIPDLAPGRWRLIKFPDFRAGLQPEPGAGTFTIVSQFDVLAGRTVRVLVK